ncbi:MAG: CoB--CoM heterodisulfide reductase iron-sulfur subunit B family protein [Deltaproteobacteria bacterium]|nr:MAG: CoB--CoM heterodisulfide reductase iron-sulfur subunit B family protein [Deltaproteobacteria bacterium]
MTYALFLGCTIPARSRNYELSARKVADKLGIELVDLDNFICCGFPIKNSDHGSSLILAAYNLALAQERKLDICTLCSSCTSALAEVEQQLAVDEDMRNEVNKALSRVGLRFDGRVKLRHFARILYEEIGAEEIKRHISKSLDDLSIAVHYGCHYLKPSEVFDHFDEVEDPQSLDALVALTGASVIDYPGKKRCCGGPILPVDEKTAISVAKEKLGDMADAGADAMCLICPFCSVMYDDNQKSIESEFGETYKLPVLYLPQLLGLAMGFHRKELGLNLNVVKTKELLSRYFDSN